MPLFSHFTTGNFGCKPNRRTLGSFSDFLKTAFGPACVETLHLVRVVSHKITGVQFRVFLIPRLSRKNLAFETCSKRIPTRWGRQRAVLSHNTPARHTRHPCSRTWEVLPPPPPARHRQPQPTRSFFKLTTAPRQPSIDRRGTCIAMATTISRRPELFRLHIRFVHFILYHAHIDFSA